MSNRQDDALPELPAAYGYVDAGEGELHRYGHIGHLGYVGNLYTEGQMRAYAKSPIASLQARLDAAEKDAARWRWFAGDCDGNGQDDLIHYLTRFVVSKAEIDAAVDAQMESE